MWFFDGYKYYIKKKTDKTIYLSCIKHKLLNCKGRGKYVNGKFYLIKTHNHLKLKEANDNLKFYSILKDLCKIPGLDPIKVYASAKERCPDVGRYISYSSCRRRIQKYKMSNNLMSQNNIKVKSLVDFARSLENIKSTCFLEYTYGDEKCKLSFKSIISNSSLKTDVNILLYDNSLINKINLKNAVLYIDATYRIVPNFKEKHVQLLTILTKVENKNIGKAIPIIWVFMNNRNEENYTKVFEYLKDNIPSFNPATVMTDYEKAIGNGLKRNYPHVKICYCYFHYSQALIKNAQKMGLISQKYNKFTCPERFIVLKKLILLALLPEQYVTETYNLIKREVITEFNHLFDNYFRYYERQWLVATTPANFSVFNLKERTNNNAEAYHKVLNKNLNKKSNINQFLNFLKLLIKENYYILESIRNNTLKLREKKKATRVQDKEIIEFYKMLKVIEDVQPEDFIRHILNLLNNFTAIKNLKNQEIENMENYLRCIQVKNGSKIMKEGKNIPKITIGNNESLSEIRNKLMLLKNRYMHNNVEFTFIVIKNNTNV